MSEAGGQGNQQGLESSNFQSHPLTSRKRGTEVKPITKGQWFNQSKPWSGFPVAQTIKNLPAMQETQVQSLSCEDPLQKEMATHSSILSQRIPGTKKPGELQSTVSQSQTWLSDSLTHTHRPLHKEVSIKKKKLQNTVGELPGWWTCEGAGEAVHPEATWKPFAPSTHLALCTSFCLAIPVVYPIIINQESGK